MAKEPLCFDFFGRLSMVVEAEPAYFPVRALLARTFSAFRMPEKRIAGASLTISLGDFTPDLKFHHLVDGAYHIAEGRISCAYRHKLARWTFAAEGLESAETRIRIAGNVFSYLVFPYESILQMILFKLGREGFAFLHALGVSKDGKADLIIGRSGVGKSTLGGKFLRDGYRLLGDDTVFVDGEGMVHGFPLPLGLRSLASSLREYGVRLTLSDRALFLLTRIIKAMTLGRIGLLFKLSASRLGDRLEKQAPLDRAIFALPAPAADFSLSAATDMETFLDRVEICGRFECVILSKLLEAYVYVFPDSGLKSFSSDLRRTLASAFARGRSLDAAIPGILTEQAYRALRQGMSHG